MVSVRVLLTGPQNDADVLKLTCFIRKKVRHATDCSSFMVTTPSISVHHKQSTKTAYGLQHRHSPFYRSFFLSIADICSCLSSSFRRDIVSPALNLIGKATPIYKLLLFLYFYHLSSCLQMCFLARSRRLELAHSSSSHVGLSADWTLR